MVFIITRETWKNRRKLRYVGILWRRGPREEMARNLLDHITVFHFLRLPFLLL